MIDFARAFGYVAALCVLAGGVVMGVNALAQEPEQERVYYEVVRIACQLPDGCELTIPNPGTGRPLTLRCRDGCIVMAQDTVPAETTLQAIIFEARPDTGSAAIQPE